MVVEVDDAGEILIPARLVQAPPHTRLEADRQGDAYVVKPIVNPSPATRKSIDSLPLIEGHFSDPDMAFRREDIYGADGR